MITTTAPVHRAFCPFNGFGRPGAVLATGMTVIDSIFATILMAAAGFIACGAQSPTNQPRLLMS